MNPEDNNFDALVKGIDAKTPATDTFDTFTVSKRLGLFFILVGPSFVVTNMFSHGSLWSCAFLTALIYFIVTRAHLILPKIHVQPPTEAAPRPAAHSWHPRPNKDHAPDAQIGKKAGLNAHETEIWDNILEEFRDDNKS